MNRKLLTGAAVLGAVVAIGATLDSGHLSPYVKAMSAAEGLDVTYSVSVVGGGKTDYHVVLAKPDKAMIQTPTKTYFADGENVTVYDKNRNTYLVREQTTDTVRDMFEDNEVSIWRSFFDAKAFDKVARTKNEGTRKRRGETLNTVSAQVDAKGEFTLKLHLSQKDNLVRQAEFLTTDGSKQSRSVLNVTEISTNVADTNMFVFNAPADARELTEADLMAEWSTDLNEALTLAADFGKGVIIDFYADW